MLKYQLFFAVFLLFSLGCSDKSDQDGEPDVPAPELPEGPEMENQEDPTGKSLLYEGFDSNLPSSFRVYDEDKRTQVTDPEQGAWAVSGGFARSRAEHMPAGAVDNWLVTGGITVTQESTLLLWKMTAGVPEKKGEAYEVYVSETGQSVKDFQGLTPIYKKASLRGTESPQVDLGGYKGKTVYIAFRHTSPDGILINLDYIKVIQKFGYNVALKAVDIQRYNKEGAVLPVKATVVNYGLQTLTDFEVSYTAGQQRSSVSVAGVNIAPMATYDVTFPDQLGLTVGESLELSVRVSMPADENGKDDAIKLQTTCCKVVPKRLLGEKVVQITCTNCGPYLYMLDETEELYPDQFIGVAVYYTDDLSKSSVEAERKEYEKWVETWALGSGLPLGCINRVNKPLNVDFKANFSKYYDSMVAPADLSVYFSFNADSSVIKATVKAVFAANIKDDLRFGGIVIENEITGYGQANAPKGRPIVHNHVARALLGGINGVEGSIPGEVRMDETHQYEFSYSVPANFKKSKLNIAGILYQGVTGEILNAAIAREPEK